MTVNFIEIQTLSGTETHAVIEHPDGSFTTMLKSTWDELEAAKENGTISQEYGW